MHRETPSVAKTVQPRPGRRSARTSSSKQSGGSRQMAPRALSRDRIVDVASGVFHRQGFHGSALDDIARVLGVTKPALYHYIGGKDQLLCEIYLRVIGLVLERLGKIIDADLSVQAKLEAVLRTHVMTVAEYVSLFTVFFQERRQLPDRFRRQVDRGRKKYSALVEALYRQGVAAGEFRDLPPKIAVFALLGMASSIYQWFRSDGRYRADDVAHVMAELASSGYLLRSRAQ
jgi:TetR/AcrR family transcriptional regulator, cholesterol catabolism regulator